MRRHLADADGVAQNLALLQLRRQAVRDLQALLQRVRGHHLNRRLDRLPQVHLQTPSIYTQLAF